MRSAIDVTHLVIEDYGAHQKYPPANACLHCFSKEKKERSERPCIASMKAAQAPKNDKLPQSQTNREIRIIGSRRFPKLFCRSM